MKINICEKQYSTDKSISAICEEIRGLTGYSDYMVSNIHKKNGDTWYFTFSFTKGKFSRIKSSIISGKVFSKDDGITRIKMKSSSYVSTLFSTAAYIVIVLITSFVRGIILNIVIIAILMISLFLDFIYVRNRESRIDLYEVAKKLKLEETFEDR